MALLERCRLSAVDVVTIIGNFFVALRGGRIIGCAAAESHGESILIRSVAVDPLFRNQGIAGRLVDVLLMQARGTETRNVFLFSKPAPAFFARWGFLLFPSDKVPAAVRATLEFQLAEASAALCMRCELR
jgi:amino-acid N-acetyltransferase